MKLMMGNKIISVILPCQIKQVVFCIQNDDMVCCIPLCDKLDDALKYIAQCIIHTIYCLSVYGGGMVAQPKNVKRHGNPFCNASIMLQRDSK